MVTSCYAAQIRDANELLNSSSGGLFTALSCNILKGGGLICGAVWKVPGVSVHHVLADDYAGITKMRGSKYLPSDITNALREIRSHLKLGGTVAFFGTPCQCAAVCRLADNIECRSRLFCCENICHGIPDMRAWDAYRAQFSKQIIDVEFKNKKTGWRNPTMRLVFEDGSVLESLLYRNSFVRAYMMGLCMREGCFKCLFKDGKSDSDITIGDFWGIEKYYSDFGGDDGVSCVICHNDKGEKWFRGACNQLRVVRVNIGEIIAGNHNYTMPVRRPDCYYKFMHELDLCADFDRLVDRIENGPLYKRVLIRARRAFHRCISGV